MLNGMKIYIALNNCWNVICQFVICLEWWVNFRSIPTNSSWINFRNWFMKIVVSISWTLDKEKAMADKKASFYQIITNIIKVSISIKGVEAFMTRTPIATIQAVFKLLLTWVTKSKRINHLIVDIHNSIMNMHNWIVESIIQCIFIIE